MDHLLRCKEEENEGKNDGFVFTCLLCRAVHLEMAYGVDTDSFLRCFSRMTSRRGYPVEIVSDQGTNFIGAARELNELVENLDTSQIQSKTVDNGVKWIDIQTAVSSTFWRSPRNNDKSGKESNSSSSK